MARGHLLQSLLDGIIHLGREEGTALAVKEAAEDFVELQAQHLDAHNEAFHGGHKDIAHHDDDNAANTADAAHHAGQGENHHHHTGVDQHEGPHAEEGQSRMAGANSSETKK